MNLAALHAAVVKGGDVGSESDEFESSAASGGVGKRSAVAAVQPRTRAFRKRPRGGVLRLVRSGWRLRGSGRRSRPGEALMQPTRARRSPRARSETGGEIAALPVPGPTRALMHCLASPSATARPRTRVDLRRVGAELLRVWKRDAASEMLPPLGALIEAFGSSRRAGRSAGLGRGRSRTRLRGPRAGSALPLRMRRGACVAAIGVG